MMEFEISKNNGKIMVSPMEKNSTLFDVPCYGTAGDFLTHERADTPQEKICPNYLLIVHL